MDKELHMDYSWTHHGMPKIIISAHKRTNTLHPQTQKGVQSRALPVSRNALPQIKNLLPRAIKKGHAPLCSRIDGARQRQAHDRIVVIGAHAHAH